MQVLYHPKEGAEALAARPRTASVADDWAGERLDHKTQAVHRRHLSRKNKFVTTLPIYIQPQEVIRAAKGSL